MKTALIILLAAAILLGLTACSQDKFVSVMECMGNNIYGIKADVRVSYKAASEVESSVSTDSEGEYVIDLEKAISLVDYVSDIQDSPSKAKALKTALSQSVSDSDADKVRTALSDEATAIADKTGTSDLGLAMGEVLDAYLESLDGHVPTYADVAILSLINRMNDSINSYDSNEMDVNDLAEEGLTALNVIKLVTDIGDVDIVGNLDISTFLVKSKDVSRANINGAYTFGATMSTIVDLITVNGEFNEPKYLDFIFQARVLKAAYDMMIYPCGFEYNIAELLMMTPEEYPELSSELGFVVEDLGRYVVCTTFVAMDRLNSFLSSSWSTFLTVFVNKNYSALVNHGTIDIKGEVSTIETFLDSMGNDVLEPLLGEAYEYSGETLEDKGLSIGIGLVQLKFSKENLSELGTEVRRFCLDFMDILDCAAVIIMDTNYESLLTIISNIIDNLGK